MRLLPRYGAAHAFGATPLSPFPGGMYQIRLAEHSLLWIEISIGYLVVYLMGLATSNSSADNRFWQRQDDQRACRSVSDRADRRRDRENRTRLLPMIFQSLCWVASGGSTGKRPAAAYHPNRSWCGFVWFERGCELRLGVKLLL